MTKRDDALEQDCDSATVTLGRESAARVSEFKERGFVFDPLP
jgi:hypothetical protein